MAELAHNARMPVNGVAIPGVPSKVSRLTPMQWLICGVAALGFAFDLYEMVVLGVVVRPALIAVGNLRPGTAEFNLWVGLMFSVPAVMGGTFGLLGGYLTDIFGRRRVLVWSILLYALSACATGYSSTLMQFLIFRCLTSIGVCVEYVAAIAWLAELFSNPKQRETVLGYTQSAVGVGGLLATGTYWFAVTYAERLPAMHSGHEAWRYAMLGGLLPAIPLMVVRPFLPESPMWQEIKAKGQLKRPSIAALFTPRLRKTTFVATLLAACFYAVPYGVLQQTPHVVPGLPEMRGLPARQVEQTVGSVQSLAELGTLTGRLLFPVLVIRIATQKHLLRLGLVPGLAVFAWVYFFAATHSLLLLKCGVFLAAVFMNGSFSFMWNYLPWVYPTHLRGTGEGFAANIGGRVFGASAALLTTQLANFIPATGAATRMAYSAGIVAILAYGTSLIASFWLVEPEQAQLPD
ncbi:MAG: MFS transporter [Candidatus Acidiferrum sp.]